MPSYEEALPAFEGYNTQVLGISVDHVPCLTAWAESLDGISYPLLSDFWPHGAVAQEYGVFRDPEGKSERALFLVDKEGIVRYADVHDIDELPDSTELFRVLSEMEPFVVARAETHQVGPDPVVLDPAVPDPVVPAPTAAEPAAAEPAAMPDSSSVREPSSVVLYCRPGCIDCRLARRFLDRNGIAYTEINVRATPGAEERVREWTGGHLISPVFDIDGRIVIDFHRAELIEALGLK
jgi:glutaredoxin